MDGCTANPLRSIARRYKYLAYILVIFLLSNMQVCAADIAANSVEKHPKSNAVSSAQSQQIENLIAFSRLYGYVRFFHPSDEASSVDWEAFAVYGVNRVKDAEDSKDLIAILKELYLPIAPTLQIYHVGGQARALRQPKNPDRLKYVAWHHKGMGSPVLNTEFESIRLNRETTIPITRDPFANVQRTIKAEKYRGKEIRLKAALRVDSMADVYDVSGFLWLRVNKTNGKTGFYEKMENNPINLKSWNQYIIQGEVDQDADTISFGCVLDGNRDGKMWVDDFNLSFKNISGRWQSISLENLDFEQEEYGEPKYWETEAKDYYYTLDERDPYQGRRSLSVEPKYKTILMTEDDFKPRFKAGQTIEKQINSELFAVIPLVLYSNDEVTLGNNQANIKKLKKLRSEINNISFPRGMEEDTRTAGFVIAWNIFQHFYPYQDRIRDQWLSQLNMGLKNVRDIRYDDNYCLFLKKFTARLNDGLSNVICRKDFQIQYYLPFLLDWIEGKAVVTDVKDNLYFLPGDIIQSIDDVPVEELLKNHENLHAGSSFRKKTIALNKVLNVDKRRSKVSYQRNNQTLVIDIDNEGKSYFDNLRYPEKLLEDRIKDLGNNIYHLDSLSDTPDTVKYFHESIDLLAHAKGIIVDLRGCDSCMVQEILEHTITMPTLINDVHKYPKIRYPDYDEVDYESINYNLLPKAPTIRGKVVFIIDRFTAIQNYYHLFDFMKKNRLAKVVGETGIYGMLGGRDRSPGQNIFGLPGGYWVYYSGAIHKLNNESINHIQGVSADIKVLKAIEDIRSGQDRFLEQAVFIINKIPWWNTWWAYTLYTLFIFAVMWSIIYFRTRQLQQRSVHLQNMVDMRTLEINQQKKTIEDLLLIKDKIFANISHELRTPLTLILSPIKNVLKKIQDKSDIDQLNIVQRNAYRLLRLVDQLLELSRLQQSASNNKSQSDENREIVYIKNLTVLAINSFQAVADEKQITLTTDIMTDACAYCSHDDYEKILINLLSNAIKYTLPQGAVNIEVSWHKDDQYIVLSVSDTGVGISMEQLPHIFERFTRVHKQEGEPISGAGIGLALVKELVDSVSGYIEVNSEPGIGTTFEVFLPGISLPYEQLKSKGLLSNDDIIKPALERIDYVALEVAHLKDQHHQESSEDDKQNGSGLLLEDYLQTQLLIIEDDADMRHHLLEIFSSSYQCLSAKNGLEGIEVAGLQVPDAIICDVMMPELNGYEVCRRLKEDDKTCHIPIILLTALGDKEHKIKGLYERADDYLTKPFDSEELAVRLENLLINRERLKKLFSVQSPEAELEKEDPGSFIQFSNGANPRDIDFIQRLEDILEKHYSDNNLNIEAVAKLMYMTSRQLRRKTSAVIGESPNNLLRNYRIMKACQFLKAGKTVTEVAYDVGFSNSNHFSSTFRACVGVSPKQYQS